MLATARACAIDETLIGLGAALDPGVVQDLLTETGTFPGGCRVLGVQILKHKPGKRCSLAYAVDVPGQRLLLFAKLFRRRRGERVFRQLHKLYDIAAHDAAIRIARPIAYLPPLEMVLTEFIDGADMGELLYSAKNGSNVGRVARTIFELHESDVDLERTWSTDDELQATERQLRQLRGTRDALKASAAMNALQSLAVDFSASASAPIHRDFYPEQLMGAGGQTVLIDLDDVRMGDRAVDLGNFRAHLTLRRLQEPSRRHACDAARERFLDSYLGWMADDRGRDALSRRVRYFEAASLTRLSGVYATRPRAKAQLPGQLLDRAWAMVHELGSGR